MLSARMKVGENATGNFQWAYNGPYTPQTVANDRNYANIVLCETPFPMFRCPSAGLPEHQFNTSTHSWVVMERSPASYLGCASGLIEDQNLRDADFIKMGSADGVLFPLSKIEIKHITDGTSNTVLAAEALHDVAGVEKFGSMAEAPLGNMKDHWPLGSDDLDGTGGPEMAAIRPRAWAQRPCPSTIRISSSASKGAKACRAPTVREFNWRLAAPIVGVANVLRCDISTAIVEEGIDAIVWRDLGTRDGQLPP